MIIWICFQLCSVYWHIHIIFLYKYFIISKQNVVFMSWKIEKKHNLILIFIKIGHILRLFYVIGISLSLLSSLLSVCRNNLMSLFLYDIPFWTLKTNTIVNGLRLRVICGALYSPISFQTRGINFIDGGNGIPRKNHRPEANHWQTLSHNEYTLSEQDSKSQHWWWYTLIA